MIRFAAASGGSCGIAAAADRAPAPTIAPAPARVPRRSIVLRSNWYDIVVSS